MDLCYRVRGQHGLYSEFKDSQGCYKKKPCLVNPKPKNKNQQNKKRRKKKEKKEVILTEAFSIVSNPCNLFISFYFFLNKVQDHIN